MKFLTKKSVADLAIFFSVSSEPYSFSRKIVYTIYHSSENQGLETYSKFSVRNLWQML